MYRCGFDTSSYSAILRAATKASKATSEGHFGLFVQVLGTMEHEPGILYADLHLAEVEERRRNMPLTQQKRHDLYELVDKTS